MEIAKINIINISPTSIITDTGECYEYINFKTVPQRSRRNGTPTTFCINYLLKDTYDSIYVYENRIAYYKPLEVSSEWEIMLMIEQDKMRERVGNKYKNINLNKKFSFWKLLKIYRHITGACFQGAFIGGIKIYKKLKYNILFNKISIKEVLELEKEIEYTYHYLFTEYFKEEAN